MYLKTIVGGGAWSSVCFNPLEDKNSIQFAVIRDFGGTSTVSTQLFIYTEKTVIEPPPVIGPHLVIV